MKDECHQSQVAYLALGSNLGKPAENLRIAAEQLAALSETTPVMSGIWRTAPVGMAPGTPDFANAVVRIETRLQAETLLAQLQTLEQALGRPADHARNTSRQLDIDIIALGDQVIEEPNLVVPHPRATERLFVLLPLQQIAPDFLFPGDPRTLPEIINQAPPLDLSLHQDT